MCGKVAKSLDAVTSTGAGTTIQFDQPLQEFSLQVTATGSPVTCNVDLEVSLDGTNWFKIVTGANPPEFTGNHPGPANYARANLTALSGGTSPTVTAWIAAA